MYLAELELHGFKSFAQRTQVKFDSGITAIVGPNGCGKSNIVDSLRWVLGEQRPSQLRSASMSNVIFNGTANRKALGMSEVSVTIHNNKGILPTEYNDVTITRRLYRSGESEYLLNKTVCRLKDIIELFMDTGMGSNAYSVIELKMVEDILSDKNADRRRLFEEAAGITKYKERRKQAFKKLDETKNDLLRVEDILVEIRKKTRSLELQAERAVKAKTFKERLETLELGLARHDFNKVKTELNIQVGRISEAENDKEKIVRQLNSSEQTLDSAKASLLEKEHKRSQAQQQLIGIQNKLQELRAQLQITRERIINEERTISQYDDEISQADVEILELKKRITSNTSGIEEAEEVLINAQQKKEDAERQYRLRLERSNEFRVSIDKLRVEQDRVSKELSELESKKIRLESRIESIQEDIGRLRGQMDQRRSELMGIADEKELLLARLEETELLLQRADHTLEEKRDQREHLFSEQNNLKDRQRQTRSKLDSKESEMALLQSLVNSDDSFPESVRFLKERGEEFQILEVISDVFETTEMYALALEAALGSATSYVIVKDMDEVERGIELLKSNKKGKATFIPLDHLPTPTEIAEGSLASKVTVPEKFRKVRDLLLGQVLAFNSIKEARQFCINTNKTGVTIGGELVTSNGLQRGGSTEPNEGIRLAFKDRMEKLERESIQLESDLVDIRRLLDDNDLMLRSINLMELQEKVKSSLQKRNGARSAFQNLDSREKFAQRAHDDAQVRVQALETNQKNYQKEADELASPVTQMQEQLKVVISEQGEKKAELEELEDNRNRAQQSLSAILIEFEQAKGKVDQLRADSKRSEQSIESIKSRLNQRADSARQSKDLIIEYRQKIKDLDGNAELLVEQKLEAEHIHTEIQQQCASEREKIEKLEREQRELRNKRESAMEIFHQLTLIKSQMDTKVSAISDAIWENYGLLMDQIKHELSEDDDPEEVRQEVGSLRQKIKNLGEVNPLAIEEYQQEKERLDFYEEQVADLTDAESQLRETIKEINDSAQLQFLETFNKIRTNFIEVFKTLFQEDDECDLLLEQDDDDPLEARIEILAKPRGKRPSTIMQLSGGEKTLTAIALLFAIYLVKPSPFCILDEVDAPLDDANIERFARILHRFSNDTQFIVITHNKKTMEKANMMYGVTMQETGVSKLVGVQVGEFS